MLFKPKQTSEEELQRRDLSFQREQSMTDRAIRDDELAYADRESRSDLIRWQQELDDELFGIINEFLGVAKIDGEYKQVSKPICNDEFIREVVVPTCRPFLSRNMINTTWNEKFILQVLRRTANSITDSLVDNYDKYDIDFMNYDTIKNSIMRFCESSAYRCLNGFTMTKNATMIKRIEATNEQYQNDQNKKRIWGVFN